MNIVWMLVWREWLSFLRRRARVIGALLPPVLMWVLLSAGFQNIVWGEEASLHVFFPGTLTLIVLFTSIFGCISLIEDRNQGFLQSVLVATPRAIVVIGKILAIATLATFQATLFVALSPLIGFHLGLVQGIALLTILLLISLSMASLGFYFAWRLNSVQGFHSIMNLVLFPMWLLSGSLFPTQSANASLNQLMILNPLTHGVWVLRAALEGHPVNPFSFCYLFLFGALFFWLSHRATHAVS